MKVRFWGVRGSIPVPGPATNRYGGNTSCVEVRPRGCDPFVIDAGTGIRRLGMQLPPSLPRVDLLLSHLHMDHIQGLGFFAPLQRPNMDVRIWGPPSTTLDLRSRLIRYLSPPLFPVHLRDLACCLTLQEIAGGHFDIGPFKVESGLVCHPGTTLGYRIEAGAASMAYLPDHELRLGAVSLDGDPAWISGFDLVRGVDVLIHDAQYTAAEYDGHSGWGHSTTDEVVRFAARAGVRHVVLFHHSPDHDDATLDRLVADAARLAPPGLTVTAAAEGTAYTIAETR